ncbi:MAG: ubiquinol-cytochrome c reductase iron-sulfur subunit [Anaerolineae bacterium]
MAKQKQAQLSRRDFMKMGVGALSALAVLEMGGASLLFMEPRSLEGEFGGVVAAGPADSFPPGSVTEFPDGRFFLVHAPDGGFLAVYRRCTHLGCTVNWEADQNRFFCPCHASSFDILGDVENPPAPRALDTFPIKIEEQQVLVDTSRIQTRDGFAPEQLAMVGNQ